MTRRDELRPHRLGAAALSSVLIHAVVFAALGGGLDVSAPKPPAARPMDSQTIPILSEDEVERLIALADKRPPPKPLQPEPKPKKEEEEKKPPERPDGQVVEIPPPPREERPDDARLLSDYNSKVEKEMVAAMNRPPQPRMRKSERKILSPGDDEDGASDAPKLRRPKTEAPRRRAEEEKPGEAQRPGEKPGPPEVPGQRRPKRVRPSPDPLPLGDGPFEVTKEQSEAPKASPGGGGGPVGGAPEPEDWRALLPTLGPEEMARQDGSIDHIEDMEKGAETFLNTRDYKYAWFFNRVKRSVQQRWRAVDAHRRYDPYGRVHGVRDRQTVVEVTLSPEGSLEDIVVTKDSGVAFLDEAAVAAFQDASPFPNPPAGLKDADGRIRFRFAFFLEINSRGLRFLRAPRR